MFCVLLRVNRGIRQTFPARSGVNQPHLQNGIQSESRCRSENDLNNVTHSIVIQHSFSSCLSFFTNCKMAKSMKDNKAIRMLKAAEEGGYGVIGVVSVCPLALSPFFN
jgi:hypothetical protein